MIKGASRCAIGSALWAAALGCGCNRPDARPSAVEAQAGAAQHAVTINEPSRLTHIAMGSKSPGGTDEVACVTCHSLREVSKLPRTMQDLKSFHLGLTFEHGQLSCAACHTESALPGLHLADGTALPLQDAMQLCRQCHGPQFRDYRHGSHGGMTGYWDLSRGPRLRNHCVDCHDPHRPVISPVVPARGPRDRFFTRGANTVAGANAASPSRSDTPTEATH